MYGHLGLPRMWVPTSLTGRRNRPTSDATPSEPSAIGFGWAIALVTTTMVVGAALITTAPFTVIVPVAAVLGSGLIAGVLVEAGDRWLARRRSNP